MSGSILDYWQAFVGLIAVFGVYITWRSTRTKTKNTITHGNRNTQTGGMGTTENTITHGDDNSQSG